MKNLLLSLIALALAACSLGSKPEIERNIENWQQAGISHYRFKLFVGCFCIFSENMPLTIEIQNGEVVAMEYQSGNEIDAPSRELFDKYATIDRIFAELEKNLHGEADEVIVEYDPTYGYPTKVNIDFIEQATDDELSLTVSGFEKLP